MLRRVHVRAVVEGTITLDEREARHARDVLRLNVGDEVEVFDSAGAVGRGVLELVMPGRVNVRLDTTRAHDRASAPPAQEILVASAVPKGERADWMIEKLSELGVHRFVPLSTARSVVHPEGRGKLDRWARLATEAAKQCRRVGVMSIDPLTPVVDFVAANRSGQTIVLSTEPMAALLTGILSRGDPASAVALLIGPEGGWSDDEIGLFSSLALPRARLTPTVLRIETAAVTAAALAAVLRSESNSSANPPRA